MSTTALSSVTPKRQRKAPIFSAVELEVSRQGCKGWLSLERDQNHAIYRRKSGGEVKLHSV